MLYNLKITLTLIFKISYSIDYYAGINGYWNNTSVWVDGGGISLGSIPGPTDNVIIDGYRIQVTSNESCNSILVKTDNTNAETHLRVDAGRTLDVANDVNVETVGNHWNDVNLLVYGTLNIGGDLNYERTANNTTNNELRLYIQDGSVNITGDFNYNHLSSEPSTDAQWIYLYNGTLNCTNTNFTQVSDGKLVLELKYASSLNVRNNFNVTRNNAHDFKLDMFNTSSINIDGNFLLDQNNCQDVYMTFNQTSSFNTGGDFTIDFDQSNNSDSHIDIELWDETDIRVEGSLDISLNDVDGESHKIIFLVDEDAQVIVGTNDGNFTESSTIYVENGGELYFSLNRDAQFVVYGDAYFKSDGNGNQSVSTYLFVRLNADINGNTLLDVKRDMYVEANLEDWDHVQFEMNGTGIINVERDLIINNNTNISHTQFLMDRDAKINVGNDLLLNQNSKGAIRFVMNTNNNGGASIASEINAGNNFTITATDLRYMELTLKDYSEINVDGDFDISISDYSASWSGIDALMSAHSEINVEGDFSIDNNGNGTNAHTIFDLVNYAQITVGTNNGTYDNDLSIINNALGELTFNLQNHTYFNVYGSFEFNKKNSNTDALLYLNDDAYINVYKHLVLKNDNDNDLLYVNLNDDASILNVRGNIDMTSAVDDDRIFIESKWESNLYIGGSFLRNAIPNKYGKFEASGEGTIHYNGDGTYDQVIAETYGDGSDGVIYQYVILNNTSTTVPQFTMEGVAEIYEDRDLKFTDGIVEATSSNYFEIQDDATVSDASDNSYVDGYIHKIGNNAFTFPVGGNDNDDTIPRYAPLGISAPSSSSTDFYCTYTNINPHTVGNRYSLEGTLNHISKEEYWLLKPVVGTPTVDVELSWGFSRSGGIVNISALRIAHWDGSIWEDYGNDATTGTTTGGTITVNNISTFSPFTLATTDAINPLPVEFISFTGELNRNVVDLNWQTTNEINNDFFTVERSIDAINWNMINITEGAGNSNTELSYEFTDADIASETYYYRLKQTDYNGDFSYSPIISILSSDYCEFNIYPNPVKKIFNISVNGKEIDVFNIEVSDLFGNIVKIENNISNKSVIDIEDLYAGIYFVKIISTNKEYVKKLIKE